MPNVPQRRGPRRSPPGSDATRIAAIDIGSNSIRQIVADVSRAGAIRVVDEMKAAPRLGAGLAETGVLNGEAMDRAVDALGRMATLAQQLGAGHVEVVATSAVRDAANGLEFLARVRRETGLQARVIDGIEEARLSFRSALAHFDLGVGRTVVIDIGGGSLELAASVDGVVDHLASLPLGAVRLTEQFLQDGTLSKGLKALRRHVRDLVRPELPAREWTGSRAIGSGGTFTNLAAMSLARQGVQAVKNLHGTRVTRGEIEHILETLAAMSADERRHVEGLNPDRADIILAGLGATAEVMARLDARELEISRYGIREGILLEAARVKPAAADPGDARARSVEELAQRCHFDERHARQVQRLALQLFDALGEELGCDESDRQLLADAALLHDIGYHISYDRHHKHSCHLILHAELLGISPTEQVMMAQVARYHRGATPKKKHEGYGALDAPLRRRVKRLAALLRVADGFDRGHVAAVGNLSTAKERREDGEVVVITAEPARAGDPLRLELWGADRKSDLLASVLGTAVEIAGPDGVVVSDPDLEKSGRKIFTETAG